MATLRELVASSVEDTVRYRQFRGQQLTEEELHKEGPAKSHLKEKPSLARRKQLKKCNRHLQTDPRVVFKRPIHRGSEQFVQVSYRNKLLGILSNRVVKRQSWVHLENREDLFSEFSSVLNSSSIQLSFRRSLCNSSSVSCRPSNYLYLMVSGTKGAT